MCGKRTVGRVQAVEMELIECGMKVFGRVCNDVRLEDEVVKGAA